jgi:hypothetical protein
MNRKHYAERDIIAQGNYYMRHLMAMTAEKLHSKSDIAAELAHRDMVIDDLTRIVYALKAPWQDEHPDLVNFWKSFDIEAIK